MKLEELQEGEEVELFNAETGESLGVRKIRCGMEAYKELIDKTKKDKLAITENMLSTVAYGAKEKTEKEE